MMGSITRGSNNNCGYSRMFGIKTDNVKAQIYSILLSCDQRQKVQHSHEANEKCIKSCMLQVGVRHEEGHSIIHGTRSQTAAPKTSVLSLVIVQRGRE